jgi:hypothetical protein
LNRSAAAFKTNPRVDSHITTHRNHLAEGPFIMRILAILLGLIFAAVAIAYWMVPAGSLPTFFPGFQAGSPLLHVKHGVASAILAVVLFGVGWYVGRARA